MVAVRFEPEFGRRLNEVTGWLKAAGGVSGTVSLEGGVLLKAGQGRQE